MPIIHESDTAHKKQTWELPPLILHPFSHGIEKEKLLQSIRLSLYSSGLAELGIGKEPPDPALLEGRYCEFRMMCFVGKDVMRWMRQCADFTARDEILARAGICEQSFSDLLVNRTPSNVVSRFQSWGVVDYRRIVTVALGLNAVFPDPPAYPVVSTSFLMDYYTFAQSLFTCYQKVATFTPLDPERFSFTLYTSEEYSRLIENTAPEA